MKTGESYRNRVAEAFRAPDAPMLVTRALHKSTMVATELRCDRRNFGRTASMPREDAYLIALQLRACPDHDLFFDDRYVRPQNFRAGVTSIYDLRADPVADLRDPYHSIMFYLPRKSLGAVAENSRELSVGELRHEPGVGIDDPVVRHLLASILPAAAKPEEAHPLFLDHVALALTAHLAHRYGALPARPAAYRGGLAKWQERRVKELIREAKDELPLSRLADECGLSVRHFIRAFKQSTGITPHRWLLKDRVDRALGLLQRSALPLHAIALECGFADQSHFTRVFTGFVGMSPGAWRREKSPGA